MLTDLSTTNPGTPSKSAARPEAAAALLGASALGVHAVAVTGRFVPALVAAGIFAAGLTTVGGRARPRDTAPSSGVSLGRAFTLTAAIAIFFDGLLGAALQALRPAGLADLVHLHRTGAIAVAGLVLASSLATFLEATRRPALRRLALAPPLLVGLQGLLGAIGARHPEGPALEAHLAVGTLLFGVELTMLVAGAPARSGVAPRGARQTLRALVELTKPRVSGLVVATFAGAAWLSPSWAPSPRAWVALAGTILIVCAANALNMYLERDIDGRMRRTSGRPLPQGRIEPEVALALGVVLACVATPLLFLGGNALVGALGLLAFVSYVFVYTPLKQRSPVALWVGAVPGAMPPLMGWATATGSVDAAGLTLFAILFLWQIPHFLAIAIYRAEDYTQAGHRVMTLESHPVAARVHVILFAAATVVATLLLGPLGVTGLPFGVAAAILGARFLQRSLGARRRFVDREAARTWARGLFFESIIYLGLLFVALGADRLAR